MLRGYVRFGNSGIQRVRAGDDLEDLLRDLGLAGSVHRQGQGVDEFAGALRGAPHRGHPRPLLGGGGLEERAVELRLDVDRQQPFEDLLRLRLVDEVAEQRLAPLLLLTALEVNERRESMQRLRIGVFVGALIAATTLVATGSAGIAKRAAARAARCRTFYARGASVE